jgi:hypothetical protein
MNALTRRLHKLERQAFPPEDMALLKVVEQIRERRRRRLEAEGLPFEEDYRPDRDLRGLTIAEAIRGRRFGQARAAASA